jgi:hypothetical protein
MARHRFTTPTKKGPWRATPREARLDAVAAGLGSVDEHTGRVYVDEIVEVEKGGEDV